MRTVLTALAFLSLTAASSTTAPNPSQLAASLAQARSESKLPATAVIVVSAQRQLFRSVGGLADVDTKIPILANPHWHIGSAIKPFIATTAVVEQSRGHVSLDAPLAKSVPEWRAIISAPFTPATLRDLLQHRGGLPSYTDLSDDELKTLGQLKGTPFAQREQLALKLLGGNPIDKVPSDRAHYSNAGYAIAAHVLERRTGRDWTQLLRDDVLRPAGATACFSGWPPRRRGEPSGHHFSDDHAVPVAPFDVPAALAPAGHLSCSMDALAALARWKLRQLRSCAKGAESCDWALGLGQSETKRNTRVFTILGSLDQFVVLMAFYPEDDRALVIAANVGEENGGREKVLALSKIVRDAFGL